MLIQYHVHEEPGTLGLGQVQHGMSCSLPLEPKVEGALRFPSNFYLIHVKRNGGKAPVLDYISAKCSISLYFTESG